MIGIGIAESCFCPGVFPIFVAELLRMSLLGRLVVGKTNVPTLMKTLDASMLRARVLANNIANVNTPGYQRVDVSFEEELRGALDKGRLRGASTNRGHMALGRKDVSKVQARVDRPIDPSQPSGVNNVDIDTEMAKLAENQIVYNYAIKFSKGVYSKLNAAIQAKSVQG